MPQILILVSPNAHGVFGKGQESKVDFLSRSLINITEEVFEIKGKDDTALDIINVSHTVNEKPLQVEIRFTVGEDEYGKGEPFNPSEEKKRELGIKIKEEVKKITKFNPSVWIIPFSDSVFIP